MLNDFELSLTFLHVLFLFSVSCEDLKNQMNIFKPCSRSKHMKHDCMVRKHSRPHIQ